MEPPGVGGQSRGQIKQIAQILKKRVRPYLCIDIFSSSTHHLAKIGKGGRRLRRATRFGMARALRLLILWPFLWL